MALEIYLNDQLTDLNEGQTFRYNFVLGDILNIGNVTISYSDAFQLPKTPQNTLILGGLGLPASNSISPYEKIKATLKYDGFDIIQNGVFLVKNANNTAYIGGVIDGARDFFKEIENKTIGLDLDLKELEHRKTLSTVISSFDNNTYKYIIADFGGKNQLPDNVINIDYLVPVVPLKYFWDKIFATFGYTYSGTIFEHEDFTKACISYPKAPEIDTEDNLVTIAQAQKGLQISEDAVLIEGNYYEFPELYNWDDAWGDGTWVNNWSWTAPTTDTFRFSVRPVGLVRYRTTGNNIIESVFRLEIMRGGEPVKIFPSRPVDDNQFDDYFLDISLTKGETISFRISFFLPSSAQEIIRISLSSLSMLIQTKDLGIIDFADAFSDYSIKDFVKEIIWRYGLTPKYNALTGHIAFYTTAERTNLNNYLDWSKYYVDRTNEMYLYNAYAQKNIFKHKYNEQEDNYNNGIITINNQNIDLSKDLAVSKIYSAERNLSSLTTGAIPYTFKTPVYPIWKPEVKEELEGSTYTQKIEYKGLNGRYYIMKVERVDKNVKLNSLNLNGDDPASESIYYNIPYMKDTHYIDLVPKYWKPYQNILNDFKLHEIELALPLPEILHLDFIKLYYFEQEASFYLLNKLTWETGKNCKAEFIKVNQ